MSNKPSWFRFKFMDEIHKRKFIKFLLKVDVEFDVKVLDDLLSKLAKEECYEVPNGGGMSDKGCHFAMTRSAWDIYAIADKSITPEWIYNCKRKVLIEGL